jgi:hypothetical protein
MQFNNKKVTSSKHVQKCTNDSIFTSNGIQNQSAKFSVLHTLSSTHSNTTCSLNTRMELTINGAPHKWRNLVAFFYHANRFLNQKFNTHEQWSIKSMANTKFLWYACQSNAQKNPIHTSKRVSQKSLNTQKSHTNNSLLSSNGAVNYQCAILLCFACNNRVTLIGRW